MSREERRVYASGHGMRAGRAHGFTARDHYIGHPHELRGLWDVELHVIGKIPARTWKQRADWDFELKARNIAIVWHDEDHSRGPCQVPCIGSRKP